MTQETPKERQERKSLYIARVLSMNHGGADEDIIIEEASKKWEEKNK